MSSPVLIKQEPEDNVIIKRTPPPLIIISSIICRRLSSASRDPLVWADYTQMVRSRIYPNQAEFGSQCMTAIGDIKSEPICEPRNVKIKLESGELYLNANQITLETINLDSDNETMDPRPIKQEPQDFGSEFNVPKIKIRVQQPNTNKNECEPNMKQSSTNLVHTANSSEPDVQIIEASQIKAEPIIDVDFEPSVSQLVQCVDQPRSSVELSKSSVDQPRSSVDLRVTCVAQSGSGLYQSKSSKDQPRPSAYQPRPSVDLGGTCVAQPGSSGDQPRASVELNEAETEFEVVQQYAVDQFFPDETVIREQPERLTEGCKVIILKGVSPRWNISKVIHFILESTSLTRQDIVGCKRSPARYQFLVEFKSENDCRTALEEIERHVKLNDLHIKARLFVGPNQNNSKERGNNGDVSRATIVRGTTPEEISCDTYGISHSYLRKLGICAPLSTRVLVTNISQHAEEDLVRQVFSLAGRVVGFSYRYLRPDRIYAEVEYDHPVEAVQAISMLRDQNFFEKKLNVEMLAPRPERRLPIGLASLGPGLGHNGTIIKGVRATVELQPIKEILFDIKNSLQNIACNTANNHFLDKPIQINSEYPQNSNNNRDQQNIPNANTESNTGSNQAAIIQSLTSTLHNLVEVLNKNNVILNDRNVVDNEQNVAEKRPHSSEKAVGSQERGLEPPTKICRTVIVPHQNIIGDSLTQPTAEKDSSAHNQSQNAFLERNNNSNSQQNTVQNILQPNQDVTPNLMLHKTQNTSNTSLTTYQNFENVLQNQILVTQVGQTKVTVTSTPRNIPTINSNVNQISPFPIVNRNGHFNPIPSLVGMRPKLYPKPIFNRNSNTSNRLPSPVPGLISSNQNPVQNRFNRPQFPGPNTFKRPQNPAMITRSQNSGPQSSGQFNRSLNPGQSTSYQNQNLPSQKVAQNGPGKPQNDGPNGSTNHNTCTTRIREQDSQSRDPPVPTPPPPPQITNPPNRPSTNSTTSNFKPDVPEDESNKKSRIVMFYNLPPSVTARALNAKLEEVGYLVDGAMKSRGRAKLKFRTVREAEHCIKLFHRSKVDGQVIEVKFHHQPDDTPSLFLKKKIAELKKRGIDST